MSQDASAPGRMLKILVWNDQAVVQLPKCGSTGLFEAWKKLGGSSIDYQIDPDRADGAIRFKKPIDLTVIMREPLERYWAGLRQDFLLFGKGGDLTEYLQYRGQNMQVPMMPTYQDPGLHAGDDVWWRLIRIMTKTFQCWRAVSIIPLEQQTAWCLTHWGYRLVKHHNRHDSALVQQVAQYRAQHPEMDDRIRNLPHIQRESQLWRCLHSTMTPEELTRVLVRSRRHSDQTTPSNSNSN